ncbi:MAG: CBS domain-containing protein [Alphaproteobacteria bacterium]
MHVEAILKNKGREVTTIAPETTVKAAAVMMHGRRIGALVVTDPQGRIAGIVSERDIVAAIAQRGERALDLKVADLMTREVVTCAPGDTVRHLMTVMTSRRMRHIPVVVDGRLAGIVSIGDVVKSRIEESEMEANMLRDYVMAGH